MSKCTPSRNRWGRAAGGALVGTAVAGGLLLSGSTPTLARSVPAGTVARAAVPSGTGYWLTNSAGDVYHFGDAVNYGSMTGKHLNAPIVGIVAAPDGKGYWLVAKDGGVFAFGSARFHNSLPGVPMPSQSIVGIAVVPEPGSSGGRRAGRACWASRADRRYRVRAGLAAGQLGRLDLRERPGRPGPPALLGPRGLRGSGGGTAGPAGPQGPAGPIGLSGATGARPPGLPALPGQRSWRATTPQDQ